MPSDESDLREIDIERLFAMRDELDRDMIRSAHSSATLEPDPRLRARIAEVEAEVKRRTSEGDPTLLDIAAKRLESEAALLPPPEPEWASALTPELIPTLAESDLRSALKRVESDLEFHRKAYGEASEIEAPGKIDMRRTTIVIWRKKAEEVLESLGGEMLRRGLPTSVVAPRARSDRPERRREGPVTAARRAIVRSAPNLSDEEICRRLDSHHIATPDNWEEVPTWVEAYRSQEYRSKVHVIFSKDRRTTS